MLVAAVILAIAVPVALLMTRDGGQPVSDSGPLGPYQDDKYRTEPTTGVRSPSAEPTKAPSATPSGRASTTPTTGPTARPSPTASQPTSAPSSPATQPTATQPTAAPSSPATQPPTAPPPPPASPTQPADNGGMSTAEQQVFTMIDNSRVEHGCARLGRDTALTQAARTHSEQQATANRAETGEGTEAIADATDARGAYDKMMRRYSKALLDCARTDLGVGYDKETIPLVCTPLGCLGETTEERWSANLG